MSVVEVHMEAEVEEVHEDVGGEDRGRMSEQFVNVNVSVNRWCG